MLIVQAVQPCQPKRRFRVRGVQTIDFAVLFDGPRGHFRLRTRGQIAQAAQIDAPEKTARLQVIGVPLEEFLRFGYRFVDALRLPIHLGKVLADHG